MEAPVLLSSVKSRFRVPRTAAIDPGPPNAGDGGDFQQNPGAPGTAAMLRQRKCHSWAVSQSALAEQAVFASLARRYDRSKESGCLRLITGGGNATTFIECATSSDSSTARRRLRIPGVRPQRAAASPSHRNSGLRGPGRIADRNRNPEMLNPPQTGHLIRFLRRAGIARHQGRADNAAPLSSLMAIRKLPACSGSALRKAPYLLQPDREDRGCHQW